MLINQRLSLKIFNKLEQKKVFKEQDLVSFYKLKKIPQNNLNKKLFLLHKNYKRSSFFLLKSDVRYYKQRSSTFLQFFKRNWAYKNRKILRWKLFQNRYRNNKIFFFFNRMLDFFDKYSTRNFWNKTYKKYFNKSIFIKNKKLYHKLNCATNNKEFIKISWNFYKYHNEHIYKNLVLNNFRTELKEEKADNTVLIKIKEKKVENLTSWKTLNKWQEIENLKDLKFWNNSQSLRLKTLLVDRKNLLQKYKSLKNFYNTQTPGELLIKFCNWRLFHNSKEAKHYNKRKHPTNKKHFHYKKNRRNRFDNLELKSNYHANNFDYKQFTYSKANNQKQLNKNANFYSKQYSNYKNQNRTNGVLNFVSRQLNNYKTKN